MLAPTKMIPVSWIKLVRYDLGIRQFQSLNSLDVLQGYFPLCSSTSAMLNIRCIANLLLCKETLQWEEISCQWNQEYTNSTRVVTIPCIQAGAISASGPILIKPPQFVFSGIRYIHAKSHQYAYWSRQQSILTIVTIVLTALFPFLNPNVAFQLQYPSRYRTHLTL